MDTFGTRLCNLREERLLTQMELSKKLGTSPRMLLRWEKDDVKPSATHLINLSKTLGVTVDELLGLSRPKDPIFQEILALAAHLNSHEQKTILDLLRALTTNSKR